jgi:hypothetical protein
LKVFLLVPHRQVWEPDVHTGSGVPQLIYRISVVFVCCSSEIVIKLHVHETDALKPNTFLRECGWEVVDWIYLAQDRDR